MRNPKLQSLPASFTVDQLTPLWGATRVHADMNILHAAPGFGRSFMRPEIQRVRGRRLRLATRREAATSTHVIASITVESELMTGIWRECLIIE